MVSRWKCADQSISLNIMMKVKLFMVKDWFLLQNEGSGFKNILQIWVIALNLIITPQHHACTMHKQSID